MRYIKTGLGEIAVTGLGQTTPIETGSPNENVYIPPQSVAQGVRDIFLIGALVTGFLIYQAGKKSGR